MKLPQMAHLPVKLSLHNMLEHKIEEPDSCRCRNLAGILGDPQNMQDPRVLDLKIPASW